MATFVMGMLVTTAVPAAITVAVRRYRLYDIERLVNRTLVYVALTGTLGAAYAAVAVLVGVALGGGTPWGTSIAAVVVVMAFRPARDRVQQVVDRRFARRRFEGLRLVEGFLDDVRAGREEPERIGAILAQALNDRGLEVVLSPAGQRRVRPRERAAGQVAGGRDPRRHARPPWRSGARRDHPRTGARAARRHVRQHRACRPGFRSRSPACAWRSGCSSRRSRGRVPGSSRPPTPSGASSSATCTTGHSSGSWRSAWPCAARRAQLAQRTGRCAPDARAGGRAGDDGGGRSCARSPAGCARACSRTGSPGR